MGRLGMLLAYDATGRVIATLDVVVARDDEGRPLGLVDFEAHEDAGGEHLDIWNVEGAAGSKVWPEWIGGRAHAFNVELEGPPGRKRIAALVHRDSGHRRERAAVEGKIAARIEAAEGSPADIRDLVGGPDRPLAIDADGRTTSRRLATRSSLPVASAGQRTDTARDMVKPDVTTETDA